jgi:hypothetical protein
MGKTIRTSFPMTYLRVKSVTGLPDNKPYVVTLICDLFHLYLFSLALQPSAGYGLLIHEVP